MASSRGTTPTPATARRSLYLAATAITFGVVASHLIGLGGAPPGLFDDEAAFGYNGWTLVHFGTDQYGTAWPLFFRSFGDYKGPVGMYAEAAVMAFLPVTPWAIRLPNALAGIALAFAAGWLGWRLTRSHVVAGILVLEAGFEPWFFHLGRTMLEADLFTPLCYTLGLAALADGGERRLRRCLFAGIALGLAIFTAQPGRFFTPVVLALVLFAFRRSLSRSCAAALTTPVVFGLVVLIAEAAQATSRLGSVSVFNGHGLLDGGWLVIADYLQYQSPWLLFIRGDMNLRHSSGFEGLLFVTASVPLVIGAVAAWRRRREPLAAIALLGTLIAPAAASLAVGVNARRDVVVLPFLLLLLAYGWQVLIAWLQRRRIRAVVAIGCVALAVIPYYVDYAFAYPTRSSTAFDAGALNAITRAHALAAGHAVFISPEMDAAARVALLPDPRVANPLQSVGIYTAGVAKPGDLVVVAASDSLPPGCTLLFEEETVRVCQR